MIITISGRQGAGKTKVAKELAKKLGYEFISIGDLRGEIAKEKGMTIDELNEVGKTEDWVHKAADEKTIEVGKTKDNFVIEGWLAYYFIPTSFKIFLDVDENIGVKRIFEDQRTDEKKCETTEEMKILLNKRLEETRKQFKKYYGQDFLSEKNFDFFLNTSLLEPSQVIEKILEKVK